VRAERLLSLQDGELVAQEQDLCGLPRFHTRDSRSQEAVRVIRRKANRRHMTGDHHGRTAGKATLLVTVADEILGTHTLIVVEFPHRTGSATPASHAQPRQRRTSIQSARRQSQGKRCQTRR
jgi:hypothetical protein